MNDTTQTTSTETPAKPKQWTSTAGPIQTSKVNKVFGSLRMEHGHHIEKTGVIGVSEDSHGYYLIFGGAREDVAKAQLTLGEEFGWTITRDNYSQILERVQAILAELVKNAPVKDKRITPEQHAKDEADRAQWKREEIERKAWLAGTAPAFQEIIRRIAQVAGTTVEWVCKHWMEYSDHCTNGDMSPVLGEFIQNYADKLGGNNVYNRGRLQTAIDYVEPAPATTGKTQEVGTKAIVKINERLGGVELWFPAKPDDRTIGQVKAAGFRSSKIGGWHWWRKHSAEALAFAHHIAGTKASTPTEKSNDGGMVQAQEDAYHDNQARMMGV